MAYAMQMEKTQPRLSRDLSHVHEPIGAPFQPAHHKIAIKLCTMPSVLHRITCSDLETYPFVSSRAALSHLASLHPFMPALGRRHRTQQHILPFALTQPQGRFVRGGGAARVRQADVPARSATEEVASVLSAWRRGLGVMGFPLALVRAMSRCYLPNQLLLKTALGACCGSVGRVPTGPG